jgi:hypothetical protein
VLKKCTKCNVEKELSCFSKSSHTKSKLHAWCKKCNNQYYQNHKELTCARHKQYNQDHKEEVSAQKKQYYQDHKETRGAYNRQYRQNHKEEASERHNDRRKIDVNYKIAGNLRTRLYVALEGNYKSGSAIRDLGCSIEDLKTWLEQQFQPGMSWNNYGEWHIDHIIPLSAVNTSDRSQLLKVCNWFNLRPLWAEENISRGNRI